MKKTVFTGSGVALVTPIKNNKVDFDKLGELLDFHVENSTDAIKSANIILAVMAGVPEALA